MDVRVVVVRAECYECERCGCCSCDSCGMRVVVGVKAVGARYNPSL